MLKAAQCVVVTLLIAPSALAADSIAPVSSFVSSVPLFQSSTKPAVDGVNGKLDVFGGAGQSNALSVSSIGGLSPFVANPTANWNGIGGAIGTVTVPIGHQFGAQIDLGSGAFGNRANGSAAGHLFWRDPDKGLIGVYASGIYSTRAGGSTMWNTAGEFEKFIGNWTGKALVGVQGFGFNTAYTPFFGESYNLSQPDRFFDKVSISYYPIDDLALTIGHIYSKNTNGINGEIEYIMPQFRGGEVAPAVYVTATYGWNNSSNIMAGLKVYFGNHDKSLIRRHREDDPQNMSAISHTSSTGNHPHHHHHHHSNLAPAYVAHVLPAYWNKIYGYNLD
jgi:hypothetical protein